MAKITGIEISYEYDHSGEFEHDCYCDSFEDAMNQLSVAQEEQEELYYRIEDLCEEIRDIEDEIFNNGLSETRKINLLNRRNILCKELEEIILNLKN